jgi:hypothetical protein
MKRTTHILLSLFGAGAFAACREPGMEANILAATSAGAPTQVNATFAQPLRVTTVAELSGCDNSPGPYITLSGELAIGGLGSRMTFRNNVKGTHEYSDERKVDVVVVPAGQTVTIPKQPSQGGVGGNPFIWIKFENSEGEAVSDEIFLGRCVQGLTGNTTVDFSGLADALAEISVADCANSPGPYITLDGNLALRSGVNAKLIFQNNDNPVGGPHEANADAVVMFRLVPPGQSVTFPKQPVLGGVGGNPWIWFAFLTAQGAQIGEEHLLGRCEQLSKA